MFKRSIINRSTEIIRSTANTGEGVFFRFLMSSKSSPVNKVPAMAIDQSRPKRKRVEGDKETIFGHLDRASWDLGHPGHVRPFIKGGDKLPPEVTAPWCPLCTLMSSPHLGVLCCYFSIPRPVAASCALAGQLLLHPHTWILRSTALSTEVYWGVLRNTGEFYSPDPVVGLFRSQRVNCF